MSAPLDPNSVGLDFLRTEISTGLTFASIAAHAGRDWTKRDRNVENARTAHAAVVRFLPTLSLTLDETREIEAGLAELSAAIAAIPA